MTTKFRDFALMACAFFAIAAVGIYAGKSTSHTAQFLAELFSMATVLSCTIAAIAVALEKADD